MKTGKLIAGILITVTGGLVMSVSMVFGIIHLAGNLYRDVVSLDVDLLRPEVELKTMVFAVKPGHRLSFWLKYPNRRLENKNFTISLSAVSGSNLKICKFEQRFRNGYYRNGNGYGQYYWLGSHDFKKAFRGYLNYCTSGSYMPASKARLVLRERLPFPWPWKQGAVFLCGMFVLFAGIAVITKSTKDKAGNIG
jgi:hypothetical protein